LNANSQFTDGIARGTSLQPTFDDGWRCQQVLDAVRRSSDSGAVVQVG